VSTRNPAPSGEATRESICLVCEMPPPAGGMALQGEQLGQRLRSEGHAVDHVRTNPLGHGAAVRRVRGLRGIVNFGLFLVQLLRSVPRVHIVHVFSHSYLSFWLFTAPAVGLGRLFGKRVVIHYHGGLAEPFLSRWGRLAGSVLRAGDALLVPSAFLVDVFRRFGHHADELPNLMALDRFSFRLREPLAPRILMARHLRAPYNPACGLRAFARLAERQSGARLTLAGDGPERPQLEALVRQLDLEQSVRFLGNIDNERMLAEFEAHDVLLNSSRADNQPVSLLEAFACGMPVVSTAVGGIPHMIEDGCNGLLAPDDDAAALAAQLQRLFDEPGLAASIARSARAKMSAHDWSRIYPRLLVAYRGHEAHG